MEKTVGAWECGMNGRREGKGERENENTGGEGEMGILGNYM